MRSSLRPSLFIATPVYGGSVTTVYVEALLGLNIWAIREGIEFVYRTVSSPILQMSRNLLADAFLRSECSHLLFIDADEGFAPETVGRMLAHTPDDVIAAVFPKKAINWKAVRDVVAANPDIDPMLLPEVAGNYQGMFSLPDGAAAMRIASDPFEVKSAGTGLMLIPRQCFERIAALPEVQRIRTDDADGEMVDFFPTGIREDGKFMGEDIGFCNLVRASGGRIFAIIPPTIHVGHYNYAGNIEAIIRHRRGNLGT